MEFIFLFSETGKLTLEPVIKLPSIVPKSQFSKVFFPVTLAGIKIPLFKKFTTSIEFGK